MKGIRKRVRFYFFACCFASAWILLAAQVPDATDNPAIIKGGLFFGITDDPIPSGAGSLELLKDTYLVSTSFCQCVIHNNGSNFEPLLVPGRNLTPFKIELKDRTGKAIPMTHLGREVSKAPNTSSSRWRDILPWGKRESAFLHWHSNPGGTRFVEFPNINQ